MRFFVSGQQFGPALLALVLWVESACGIEVRLDRSWRSQLLQTVGEASLEDRKVFAEIALQEMIIAYDSELHDLSADAGVSRQRSLQWAAGTGGYLDALERVLRRLPLVASVDVVAERVGPLRLVVGDTPVVVSGPDFARQEALEARILDAYCLRRYCGESRNDVMERIRSKARESPGHWSISDRYGSMFRTEDGLNCLFEEFADLNAKKALCERLVFDLRVIASSLVYLSEQGFPMEWAHLALESGARHGEQRLLLNDRGDYLVLELSVLDPSSVLWLQARDWIREHVEGRYYETFFRDVEMLGSQSR